MFTKTRIVRIGNSKGIRIPKTLLDEAELPEEIELHAERGRLIVQAAHHARSGWTEAAKNLHARGDDVLLGGPTRRSSTERAGNGGSTILRRSGQFTSYASTLFPDAKSRRLDHA